MRRTSQVRNRIGWIVLCAALLAWSYVARPIYDFIRIAVGRVWDAQVDRRAAPLLRRDHAALVDTATEQADELDRYFRAQRASAANAPEIGTLDYSSAEAYTRSTEALRKRLRDSLGYVPEAVPPPDGVVQETSLGEDDLATYTALRVPIAPGLHCEGVYLRPKHREGRLPLIIAAHGRGGQPERGPDGKVPMLNHSNRDLGRGALERGYAVWMPMFTFYARDSPDDLRERLSVRAQEAGTTLPAIEILKVTRSLEALCHRAEIDPSRVAMVGLSYGGFYTLYATALEPRIRAAVVAAYFNDREAVLDSSEPNGFSDWRFPNSLGILRDPFVTALVCPRPLQVQAGNQDQLFPVEGARRAAPLAAEFYSKLGVNERFQFLEFVGRHDLNGKEAWDFLDRSLNAKP